MFAQPIGPWLIAASMHELVRTADATEKISDALRRLLREAHGRPLMIREMVEILHGRGLQFVVILLCLPFLAPVTIPGVSIPFGLAIALCGLRIAFGHKPWLPGFVLNRRVWYAVLEKMVHFGCRIYEKVEKVVRPRLGFLLAGPGMGMLIGLAIALSGIFLRSADPASLSLDEHHPRLRDYFPISRAYGERWRTHLVWIRLDPRRRDLRRSYRFGRNGGSRSPLADA